MAKIYTRTGDSGDTSLLGGIRVSKSAPRIEAIGSIDETSAAIGAARLQLKNNDLDASGIDEVLTQVQHRLFDLGAELATPDQSAHQIAALNDDDVAALESAIDRFDATLPPLREFILPGGSAAAAQLHVARNICRRAERRLVELAKTEHIRGEPIRYVNRLSDLLFVVARAANHLTQTPDVTWQQRPKEKS
jgi:cob(I)alamin adenosyltransferase